MFIVLRADDNGEGGTFALYSLLCRRARLGFLPGHVADDELSSYKMSDGDCAAPRVRRAQENRRVLQAFLLVLALIGACMVIGDGVLTPALSGERFFLLNKFFFRVFSPLACLFLEFLWFLGSVFGGFWA